MWIVFAIGTGPPFIGSRARESIRLNGAARTRHPAMTIPNGANRGLVGLAALDPPYFGNVIRKDRPLARAAFHVDPSAVIGHDDPPAFRQAHVRGRGRLVGPNSRGRIDGGGRRRSSRGRRHSRGSRRVGRRRPTRSRYSRHGPIASSELRHIARRGHGELRRVGVDLKRPGMSRARKGRGLLPHPRRQFGDDRIDQRDQFGRFVFRRGRSGE